jgi:hypothetical protein
MTPPVPASSTEASAPPQQPPASPRELTPAAARRAWREPRVQFWWAAALGILAAAAFVAVGETITWNDDARLLREGTKVDAVVWPSGARIKNRPVGPQDFVTVEFTWNGQQKVLTGQRLDGRDGQTITGEPISIYVDAKDPDHWTARTSPPSLARMLVGAMTLALIAVLLLLVSVVRRRGVLGVWRDGEARLAAVVQAGPAALAPRSWLVRCALAEGKDRRLITVYIPRRLATPQKGDALWLIMPSGKPGKALAAMSFVVVGGAGA